MNVSTTFQLNHLFSSSFFVLCHHRAEHSLYSVNTRRTKYINVVERVRSTKINNSKQKLIVSRNSENRFR